MAIADTYVAFNEWLVSHMGDTHTLAHVQIGLAIYVVVQLVIRDRRASAHGLIYVIGAELANEILEAAHYGSMRWADTVGDVVTTLFWPIILYGVGTYRRRRWVRLNGARPVLATNAEA